MWETVKDILLLVVGAGISIVSVWIESKRSRKWALEDRKIERGIAAREIRLREGEEKIKDYTTEFYYLVKLSNQMINVKSEIEIESIHKILAGYEKMDEEMDKGKAINEVSIKSLEDEQLTKALEKVDNSIRAYKSFDIYLAGIISAKGITPLQNEIDKNAEKELALRQNYLSSVTEFLRRINELRSQ